VKVITLGTEEASLLCDGAASSAASNAAARSSAASSTLSVVTSHTRGLEEVQVERGFDKGVHGEKKETALLPFAVRRRSSSTATGVSEKMHEIRYESAPLAPLLPLTRSSSQIQ